MKNFGDLLRTYIEKSGYSIYGLAKKADINRTTLQKILSGDRTPSSAILNKLLPFLKLTPAENDELFSLIEKMETGEELYTQRRLIKNMLESYPHVSAGSAGDDRPYNGSVRELPPSHQLYYGSHQVEMLLSTFLQHECIREHPSMKINAPANTSLFHHTLLYSRKHCQHWEQLHVQHIICLLKTGSSSTVPSININSLGYVLPLLSISGLVYDMFYYYDSSVLTDAARTAFPYYVLFSDAVVLLTADCQTAMPFYEKHILQHFHNLYDLGLQNTAALIQKLIRAEDILPYFIEADLNNFPLYSLEFQPCFCTFLTEDILFKYAEDDIPNRPATAESLMVRARQLYDLSSHTCIFSKAGLLDFAERGYLADIPPAYMRPLDIPDRIYFLKSLYEEIASGRQEHRMVNPLNFPISEQVICALHQNTALDFNCFSARDSSYNYIHIVEPTLLDAFADFFQYLSSSSLVYSRQDTMKAIEDCIRNLR